MSVPWVMTIGASSLARTASRTVRAIAVGHFQAVFIHQPRGVDLSIGQAQAAEIALDFVL